MKRLVCLFAGVVGVAMAVVVVPVQAQRAEALHVSATATADLRRWDAYVTTAMRAGDLRVQSAERDPMLPARTVERLQQYYRGVRIWGANVVRDSDNGVPMAIFGELIAPADMVTTPRLDADRGQAALLALGGSGAVLLRPAELMIVSDASTGLQLAYSGVVASGVTVFRGFVDAATGAELFRISAIETQSAIGTGNGVLGDNKKMSVLAEAGTNYADDQLRPPRLRTYDLRNSVNRALAVLNGASLQPAERASDADNQWSDAVAVDAHTHVGWTYDYYFKRLGRRGLDNADRPLTNLINGVSQQGALTLPFDLYDLAFNAFWCGECGTSGVMYFGNGLPPGFFFVSSGQNYGPFAGALDVVAHELTHGVTDSSSGLVYRGESGALNEAFSDIMGTSVEFYFQAPGVNRGQADYLIAEDTVRAVRAGALNGLRSMADPLSYGDPDHYSRRYTGTDDGGGVHTNSSIANHAFYLAIEGGTNRTSGLAVQGVGASNREQIEKVFYRGFVFLLPSNATFATARAATIQAARDLYGAGSAPERAVTQAWTAVGVQ